MLVSVKPSDKQLKDLFTALKTYYVPQPLITVERFYFHRRNEAANESIAGVLWKKTSRMWLLRLKQYNDIAKKEKCVFWLGQ